MQEKNNMASEIVKKKKKKKKKNLDPHDGNDSILFDISKCRWLLVGLRTPRPPFHICTF